MQKGINYWAFPPNDDGSALDPIAAMEYAKVLGYDCFEFTVSEAIPLDMADKDLARIRDAAEKIGLRLPTVAGGLAWGCSPSSPDAGIRDKAVANTEAMLRIAAGLGAESILHIPAVVSTPIVPDQAPVPYVEALKWAKDTVERLLPSAGKYGVNLAVENVWNRFLLDPLSMSAFVDSFSSDRIGVYFDMANVMLYGHPEDWIRTLGGRILAVHMKDFRVAVGNLDGFVDLLAGDVDFPAVMKALADIGYDGPHTIEYVPGVLGAAEKGIAALKLVEKL